MRKLWRKLVARAERRWPEQDDGALEFFWRFCHWAAAHGLLRRDEACSITNWECGRFYNMLPNWRFWLGPYYKIRLGIQGHYSVARLNFRQSLIKTWWMLTGKGSKDIHLSGLELFEQPDWLEVRYAARKLAQAGMALRRRAGNLGRWLLAALEAGGMQPHRLCDDRQVDGEYQDCAGRMAGVAAPWH